MPRDDRLTRLTAHTADCADCQAAPPPLGGIVTLLDSAAPEIDAAALSRQTCARLQPELERRVRALAWRRTARGVLLALLPLPFILAYDAYLLQLAYDCLRTLLPVSIAAYLVFSYAAGLLLLFATTYAAIPVIVTRRFAGRRPAIA